MGTMFGKIDVETPKYTSISKNDTYEIREYPASVAVQTSMVTGGNEGQPFNLLAQYIGVVGTPQNKSIKNNPNDEAKQSDKSQPIAMTAPVITKDSNNNNGNNAIASSESIAMTAPVITKDINESKENNNNNVSESMSMTAPVITSENKNNNGSDNNKEQIMQFILPSEYNINNAPIPTDNRVKLVERPISYYAVSSFSGWWDQNEANKQSKLLMNKLENDGIVLKKPINWEWYRYNPPWTIPMLRLNEIAVELDKDQYNK